MYSDIIMYKSALSPVFSGLRMRRVMSAVAGLGEVARKALSQLAQFGQLKTIGNGQTIGAPCTTERRERDPS
jgi:hypothetical protein